MTDKIEIVYYEFVKSLPNHPEMLLIDVREPLEIQQTGRIPTSINIPLSNVKSALGDDTTPEEFKSKYGRDKPLENTTVIFYCRSGRRSQQAAEFAVALGYTNVKNYKGSWIDWAEHEGLPK
ncbi:rhodanese domain-containing protein CG4456 [Stomoxys calcitrans]|uniref:Rhodanese domain-containing protein n=1 Tax=Stomoxys calcitrans TaxID=35570 RepID=A0A1I8P6X1_STOCA|nr:rhodanese domain-containing protein CG4456 [Stomoxys calcitrans]